MIIPHTTHRSRQISHNAADGHNVPEAAIGNSLSLTASVGRVDFYYIGCSLLFASAILISLQLSILDP